MATTGISMGVRLLDALHALPGRVALLHGEAAVAGGEIPSDLDMVVDTPPDELIEAMLAEVGHADHAMILRWPYDRQSVTYFFCDPSGTQGVQLDLVYDAAGQGRYGFRSGALLDRAVMGTRWMRLDPDDEYLYLLRKRQVKRDRGEVTRLLQQNRDASKSLMQRGRVAFAPEAATNLESMLSTGHYVDPGGAAFDRRFRNIVANPGYYIGRISERVGWWVALPDCDRDDVEAAVEPLARLLPRVSVSDSGLHPMGPLVNRMRAGLFLTIGPGSHLGADRVLRDSPGPEALRRQLVTVMAESLAERQKLR